jgi:CubicO group peptidase (beta-lactamase class C family)
MPSSDSLPEAQQVDRRAIGYMRARDGKWVPNTDTLPTRGTSAGGGYSTVSDLLHFAEALMQNRLLSAEYTNLMITAKTDIPPVGTYAYGFQDERATDGSGWVGHAGGAEGMNGDLRIFVRSGYVIAVLANLDPPAAHRIAEFLDGNIPG